MLNGWMCNISIFSSVTNLRIGGRDVDETWTAQEFLDDSFNSIKYERNTLRNILNALLINQIYRLGTIPLSKEIPESHPFEDYAAFERFVRSWLQNISILHPVLFQYSRLGEIV